MKQARRDLASWESSNQLRCVGTHSWVVWD